MSPTAPGSSTAVEEAVVLAGGFGTRLRGVVDDRPKPLAEVAGRPFLAWLLEELAAQDVRRAILATGHLGGMVEAAIGPRFAGLEILYSRETTPLGTGGAAREALALAHGGRVFVLNGDTWLRAPMQAMAAATAEADIAMAVVRMEKPDRYGTVSVEGNRITGFSEKLANAPPGWINGGLYCARRDLAAWRRPGAFSLERDVLEADASLALRAYPAPGPFIDIGTPEDYRRAQTALPEWRAGQPPEWRAGR